MTTSPPTGTVTFLFTDIEGSARLAQQVPAAWHGAKARHHTILHRVIEAHGGYVFQVIGDAFCAAFHTASDALAAGLEVQRTLHAEQWGEVAMRVRMGIHSGAATVRPDGDYEGYLTLVRVQRIMSAAHGGQVLMSREVADLVGRDLSAGVMLRDLGRHRLKDLAAPEHLHQLVAPELPGEFPPLKTADHPNNLPTQLTSFIGRDSEVREVRCLLSGTRLLTLTGSGGVGKTRLALQAASEELAAFPDGVWLAELAPLADPALIASNIASAIGVREEPSRPMLATLGDHFRAKTTLIVLDNCEHLIADAARVCDTLLHAAPSLKVICTSREALGIAGETAYRVPSLGIPLDAMPLDALSHVASVALFTERARSAKTDFALTMGNAPALSRICRRLDGIPLAIELAAARITVLSPEQIGARLDDRFRLLTGGSRTALPRQQTLRAAVDWSYSLLTEPERVLFRRLAVFAGGWTLETAEAVCAGDGLEPGDILDLLTRLVDKSLVVAETTEDEVRYRLLETVRQYAREKLLDSGEGEAARTRHLAHFVQMAEVFESHDRDPETARWIGWVERDYDNIRAALDWSLDSGAVQSGMRLAGALPFFSAELHPGEGLNYASALLARLEAEIPAATRGKALYCAGFLHWTQGEFGAAQILLEDALALLRTTTNERAIIHVLDALCQILLGQGDPAAARNCATEQLERARRLAIPAEIGTALVNVGEVAHVRGELAEAARLYQESATILRANRDKYNLARSLRRMGQVALLQTNYPGAGNAVGESIAINFEIGDQRGVAAGLITHASLLSAQGKTHDACRALGSADGLLKALHTSLGFRLDMEERDRVLATLRTSLDPTTLDAALAAGSALNMNEAVAHALELRDA